MTVTLPLFYHSTDMAMRESLARHFSALKTAIRSSEHGYDALKNPSILENLGPQFYCSLETKTSVDFKYFPQIDEKCFSSVRRTVGERI